MNNFFEKYPEIYAVLSEKEDGSMRMLEDRRNEENRKNFFRKNGINPDGVISADLVHGNNIVIIEDDSLNVIKDTDGLVTSSKNISLSVTVSDCIPIFFFDPEKNIIAIAHAGWRGIVNDIIIKTIKKIKKLGSKEENIKVAVGPGINSCHFEIKEDVLNEFDNYKNFIIRREDGIFVDLKGIIKKQLEESGVRMDNIESDDECTYESEKYFSYRRDKPEVTEAMIAVIGFKK